MNRNDDYMLSNSAKHLKIAISFSTQVFLAQVWNHSLIDDIMFHIQFACSNTSLSSEPFNPIEQKKSNLDPRFSLQIASAWNPLKCKFQHNWINCNPFVGREPNYLHKATVVWKLN